MRFGDLMGTGASKGDSNTPLLNLCKERNTLIRGTIDARYHLAKSHLLYFQSLLGFTNALTQFVLKDLTVIPYSSDDDSSGSEFVCSGSGSDSDSDSEIECLGCDQSQTCPVSNNGGNKVRQGLDHEFVSVNDQNPQKPNQTWGSSNNVGLGFFEEEFVSAPVEDFLKSFQNPSSVEQNSFQGVDIFGLYEPVYNTQCNFIEPDQRDEAESDGLREVREREGIPDLETDSDHNSLVRKKKTTRNHAKRDVKFNAQESSSNANVVGEVDKSNVEASPYDCEVASDDDDSSESYVEETQKTPEIGPEEMKSDEEVGEEYESSSSFSESSGSGSNDLRNIVEKINHISEKAACNSEMSELLEVSKVIHHEPLVHHFKEFASWVLGSSGKRTRILATRVNALRQEDLVGSLSMTLEELSMWEKKLYKEVTDEEKLRVLCDNGYKTIKHLDQTGAEPDKIDEAKTEVKLLESEINVPVIAVERISMRIHKIRDEELWFQMIAIINGFKEMWRFSAKCHHKQFQAISSSKSIVHIVENGSSSRKATHKVEEKIIRYKESLRGYIDAHKGFVRLLNEWLNRNIMEEDETEGEAPEIFKVCREWLREIEGVEEFKVLSAVEEMGSRFRGLGLKQVAEEKQRIRIERLCKELEKKANEREDLSLRESVMQEKEKHERLIRELNDNVSVTMQDCLVLVFEALEDYCFRNFKAYQNIRIVSTETLLFYQS